VRLNWIEAIGFRNLQGKCGFSPELNIFYGDNAQGKTNWLEAIYVLGNTRSFRATQTRDLMNFASEGFTVRGEVMRGSLSKLLQISASASSKELSVNGKRESLSSYLGNLVVFSFSIEDMEIIRGDPGRRRRFLDRGIVAITPSFLKILSRYNHVLKQKNRLLLEARQSGRPEQFRSQIEAWNDQLIELGREVHQARCRYVERLNLQLHNELERAIFGAEQISLRYKSSPDGELDRYAELLAEQLEAKLSAEIAAGHALIGPHRDDLLILANGRELAKFGSAGQQKSALLMLDLAQISIYNFVYEEFPVLLIDDFDAELDSGRIEALLLQLEGRIQTFMTTSRRSLAARFGDRAQLYRIEKGRATRNCREKGQADGEKGDS
jgi:DNA replication and repair protein RecF